MVNTADAIVIGGGVMGASILYNLALKGFRKSILLERDTIGAGSTGRSSGAIRMHYSTEVNAKLAHVSLEVFSNFDQIVGGEAGFVNTGYMVFAPKESEQAFFENIAMQQSLGIDTERISLSEAAAIAPAFHLEESEHFAWESSSGHADPSATTSSYLNMAKSFGAGVFLQSPVVGLEPSVSKTIVVSTVSEQYESDIVVLATGPWSGQFLSGIGINLPLLPTRHEVFLLKRDLDMIPFHPGGGDMTNLTYFRPEGKDLTLVGNGNEEEVVDPDTYNQKYTLSYAEEVWNRLSKRMPGISEAA